MTALSVWVGRMKREAQEARLRPCLKQETRCVIVRQDGRRYEATNGCDVDGLTVCPRVTAGCPTGTGYELCGSLHAEARAARLAAESSDVPGTAYLTGHTWFCKDCQDLLRLMNVHTFTFGPPPMPSELPLKAVPFRLSMTMDDRTSVIEMPLSGLDIFELLEEFRLLAMAAGFQPDSWEDGVIEMAQGYIEAHEFAQQLVADTDD